MGRAGEGDDTVETFPNHNVARREIGREDWVSA